MTRCRFDLITLDIIRCRLYTKHIKERYNEHLNHIICVMVSMTALNFVHRRFKPWSAPMKDLNRYLLYFQNRGKELEKGRPLLIYENKKNVMTYSFCTSRNNNNSSAFVTGCDIFRIENIKNKIQ